MNNEIKKINTYTCEDIKFENVYMFKNQIRHFLSVSNLDFFVDESNSIIIDSLSHSTPIKFPIRKYCGEDAVRILSLPNPLNFYNLYIRIKDMANFQSIEKISPYSRMKVNLNTGDFSAYGYYDDLKNDLYKLCCFDKLVKLDIDSFYDRIYTHNLLKYIDYLEDERFLTNIKMGETNGILMGNYTSLYLAERYLSAIVSSLKKMFDEKNVICKIKYFSDDFYIFCDDKDIPIVKETFERCLHIFGLQTNSKKTEIYNYEEYNSKNIIDKYWNTIVGVQKKDNIKINEINRDRDDHIYYRYNFLNQLIYRKNKIKNEKLESVFIRGFFKNNYFIDIEPNNYIFSLTNLHQILHLYGSYPEVILYTIEKFKTYNLFKKGAKDFFEKRFEKSLDKYFFEEQIYFFYSLACVRR